MSKYPICQDCYYNNREPAICEDCHSGSEFEPRDTNSEPVSKPIKIVKRTKELL